MLSAAVMFVVNAALLTSPASAQEQGRALEETAQHGTTVPVATTPREASDASSSSDVGLASGALHGTPVSDRTAASSTGDTPSAGPTVAAARAGVESRVPATSHDAAATAMRRMGGEQDVALMTVGGAAFVAGLLIGGGGGAALAIGGAVVGLYGLYHFMQ